MERGQFERSVNPCSAQIEERTADMPLLENRFGGVAGGWRDREIFRSCRHGGKQRDYAVHLGELERALQHSGGSRQAEISLQLLEAGKAANDAADRGAVN